jgi:hypothetical protein
VTLGYPAIGQAWYVVCPGCCDDPERVRQALGQIKPAPLKLKLKLKGWNSHEKTANEPTAGTKRKMGGDEDEPATAKKHKRSGDKGTKRKRSDDDEEPATA